MRGIAVMGYLSALAVTAPATGQSFLGEWVATARVGDNDVSEKVSVSRAGDGYSVTAKLLTQTEAPQAGPGLNVKLDGDRFSYVRALNLGGNSVEITYSGVVDGDIFTGEAEVGGNKIPYNGVRDR